VRQALLSTHQAGSGSSLMFHCAGLMSRSPSFCIQLISSSAHECSKRPAPCLTTTAENMKMCGGKCVDISFDRSHCGACNKPCKLNQICDTGKIIGWPTDSLPCQAPCELLGRGY